MEKIVDVRHLKPGIFVCRLDRPWLETPFRLQGFVIASAAEVDELRRCCKYVYIDPERGADAPGSENMGHLDAKLEAAVLKTAAAPPPAPPYEIAAEDEIDAAVAAHGDTVALIGNVLEDARLGRSVDSASTKKVVANMAASIMRNPDALLFLTQLNDKDNYTTFHSIDVCILALAFGRHLGLSEADLNLLGLGALLHDIGKMRIPAEILNKAGTLSREEFDLMKGHVDAGVEILEKTRGIPPKAIEVAQNHHERYDGKGYPRSLKGDRIGLFGCIAGIVDVYDAITSDRVYHPAITPYEALKHMYGWRKKDFDEELVLGFIQCVGIYPVGSLVLLSTGDLAVVIAVHPEHRLRPRVKLVRDPHGQRYEAPVLLDLMHEVSASAETSIEIRSVADPTECGVPPWEYVPSSGPIAGLRPPAD